MFKLPSKDEMSRHQAKRCFKRLVKAYQQTTKRQN